LRAAFDAAYAPNPSSKERKFVVDPESDEINTRVWIWIGTVGMEGERGEVGRVDRRGVTAGWEERSRRAWAVRSGPIVLVWRWWAKAENVL
jgi:hypothetical protein